MASRALLVAWGEAPPDGIAPGNYQGSSGNAGRKKVILIETEDCYSIALEKRVKFFVVVFYKYVLTYLRLI